MSALLYPFINERGGSPSSSPANAGWTSSAGGAPGGVGLVSPGWQSTIPAGADPVDVIASQLQAIATSLAPGSTQDLLSTWNLMHNATGLAGGQQQALNDFLLKNAKPLQDKLKEAQDWLKNVTGRDQSLPPEALAEAPPKVSPTAPCEKECEYIKPQENAYAPQSECDRLRTNKVIPSDKEPERIKYDFGEGEEDALQYSSNVNGKDIPIIISASADDPESTLANINSSLGVLDSDASGPIGEIVANPRHDPTDMEIEKNGVKGVRRTSALTTTVVDDSGISNTVTLFPSAFYRSLDSIMLHEAAHPKIGNNSGDLPRQWNDICENEKPSPSEYGDESVFEDFCESTILYKAAKGGKCESVFKETYPKRYELLEKIYNK